MRSRNPWRVLRSRHHIVFDIAPLPAVTGGAVYGRWQDGIAGIVIDPSLPRRQRRAALAHELIHDERGPIIDHPGMPPGWRAVVLREERAVDREVIEWLIPRAELEKFVAARCTLEEGGTAADVAEEFDVPDELAERALKLLEEEWG